MIVDLAVQGKKIGVTANSHKVIGELLAKAADVAEKRGALVRIGQLSSRAQPTFSDAIHHKTNDEARDSPREWLRRCGRRHHLVMGKGRHDGKRRLLVHRRSRADVFSRRRGGGTLSRQLGVAGRSPGSWSSRFRVHILQGPNARCWVISWEANG